jgi:hypothetical protein
MPSASVTIKKNKDMEKALKDFEQEAVDAVRLRIRERARFYVAVDTGKLRDSIRLMGKYTVGSTVRYAGYQEGTTPTYTRYTPFLRPALSDVMRGLPGILGKTWRGTVSRTAAGPTKTYSGILGKVIGFFRRFK